MSLIPTSTRCLTLRSSGLHSECSHTGLKMVFTSKQRCFYQDIVNLVRPGIIYEHVMQIFFNHKIPQVFFVFFNLVKIMQYLKNIFIYICICCCLVKRSHTHRDWINLELGDMTEIYHKLYLAFCRNGILMANLKKNLKFSLQNKAVT